MFSPLFVTLASSYFWYFAVIGLMAPFLAVFLDGRGFTPLEIGQVLAAVSATKVLGPALWAILSDKTGKQVSVIQLGAVLSTFFFFFLFFSYSYWPITLLLVLFSLFWTAILPQMEVLTLSSIKRSPKIYARIRLWGSVGFTFFAIASGELIEIFSSEVYLPIGLFILLGLCYASFKLKQSKGFVEKVDDSSSIFEKIFSYKFLIFFFAGLMLQVSFGPFNGFFALYLRDLSYPGFAVGSFIAIGVIAEITIFIVAGKLFKHYSIKSLLVFSMFVSAIRWYVAGNFGDNAWLLGASQLLHAFGFGLYHSASMQFIQLHFNKNQQNRGQAVYIGGVYGVGGAIGAYLTGVVWTTGLAGFNAWELAAFAALVSALLAFLLPRSVKIAHK